MHTRRARSNSLLSCCFEDEQFHRWLLEAFSPRENGIYHLTCAGNLAITNPVQTGPVWGCSSVGRSKTSRGRVPRKCIATLQAQGAAGRHYQGGQASLLLPEAGREEARQGGFGAKACSKKESQRFGLSCNPGPLLPSSGLPVRQARF